MENSTTAFQNPSLMSIGNETQNTITDDNYKTLVDTVNSNGQKIDEVNGRLDNIDNGIKELNEKMAKLEEVVSTMTNTPIEATVSETPEVEAPVVNEEVPVAEEEIAPIENSLPEEPVVPETPEVPEPVLPTINDDAVNNIKPETEEQNDVISIDALLGNVGETPVAEEAPAIPEIAPVVIPEVPVAETPVETATEVEAPVAEVPAMPEITPIVAPEAPVAVEPVAPVAEVPTVPEITPIVTPEVPVAAAPAAPVSPEPVPTPDGIPGTVATPDIATSQVTPVIPEAAPVATPEVPVVATPVAPVAPVEQPTALSGVTPINIAITEAQGDGKQRSVVISEQSHVKLQTVKADNKTLSLAA